MASSLQQTSLTLTQPLPPLNVLTLPMLLFLSCTFSTSFVLHVFRPLGLTSDGIFSLKLNPTAFILEVKILSRNSFQPLSALYRYPIAESTSQCKPHPFALSCPNTWMTWTVIIAQCFSLSCLTFWKQFFIFSSVSSNQQLIITEQYL